MGRTFQSGELKIRHNSGYISLVFIIILKWTLKTSVKVRGLFNMFRIGADGRLC
jgi:hypothetical protein